MPHATVRPESPRLPDPLHPRPEESEIARRACTAADLVAGFAGSARLDSRFRLAVRDLAHAVRGLEGMRACGFAPEIAEAALPQLERVVTQVERALENARPQLEAERREREAAARASGRRRRSPGTRASAPAS